MKPMLVVIRMRAPESFELVGKLTLGIERGEVHDAPAGFEHAEEREGMIGRIGQVERDRRARADAQVHQAGGEASTPARSSA